MKLLVLIDAELNSESGINIEGTVDKSNIIYYYSMMTINESTKNNDIQALTKLIVDKAKAEVKIKYGKKKRHRQ